jgi:hypothetical protein
MRVLLYSAVLYLFGIAMVLYLRPSLMFKHDRSWKEFGLDGVDTTYFPFWLFCIVWAVGAHALVRLVYSDKEGHASPLATASATASATVASLTAHMPATSTQPLKNSGPVVPEPTEEAKPGYYKLDDSLMKRKGVPRYIYVGEEKPSDLEE